jgi:tetratricopeptide (TPR) repeat protein
MIGKTAPFVDRGRTREYPAPGASQMKRVNLYLLLWLAAAAIPSLLQAAERVTVARPLVSPEGGDARGRVDDLLDRSSAAINRLHGDSIRAAGPQEGGDYTLATVASVDKDNTTVVITLIRTSDGEKSPPLTWYAPASPEQPLWLARAVYLLWSSFRSFRDGAAVDPPVFVDELPGALLSPLMPPMGIAAEPNGNIAIALLMSCVELDPALRPVGAPGSGLEEKGVPYYAGGVSATPGGSLFLKPNGGRDLYRFQPGGAAPQRIPTGLELASIYYWTALADGSALLVDSTNRKAWRVAPGRRRAELALFPNPSSWPTAWAAGADGTIWVYDPLLKGVRIFTAEGTPADILLPLVDPARSLVPTAMAVGPDGSFLMLSAGHLLKFRRDGAMLWEMASMPGSDQETLPAAAAIAVDWSRGTIYLADMVGKRIIKLLDRAYCRDKGIHADLEEKILAARAKNASNGAAAEAEAARIYESAGSLLMAKAHWQKVDDADPGNAAAEARLLAIELGELKAAARDLDTRARSTFARVGVESARTLSVQAIQKYELILSKSPGDAETRKAMEDLKALFSSGAGGPSGQPPITVSDIRVANLFPSLMQWYAAHPAGSVAVKNSLAVPVETVKASLFIPGFMDLPSESAATARLAPGESVTLTLTPRFNQKVLDLQEDMSVQAQVIVSWLQEGTARTVSQAMNATIYRNSALTWDDTRKISSFITPNEQTVAGFAARAIAGGTPQQLPLSHKIFQAMRIFDALGTYGIAYVEDPDSPFSKALGKAEVVDTVRFPRTTLSNRTGDCDDTTALICSLFESAGIRTAVLTTPGHIFMAFDSGEPADSLRWLSSPALAAIANTGSTWIPLETTVVTRGFMAAWASASELVKKYAGPGPFEFIPVAAMRDAYPALPLPPSAIAIAEPSTARVEVAFSASSSGFISALYSARVKEMDATIAGLSGRQAVVARVQEGVLHALFGRMAEAEASFRKAIGDDPSLVSPYVNLANTRLISRDLDGALAVVKQGLGKNGGSALLNLLAARIYAERGETALVTSYFAKVKASAPELAARFPDLAGGVGARTAQGSGSSGAGRASGAGENPIVIWDSDR